MKSFLLLFIISLSVLTGQEKGIVTGKVIDKLTREPLPGVNISVIDTDLGAATAIDGKFRIENLAFGTYRIRASFVGYNPVVVTDIVVTSAKEIYLEFELVESSIELDGITVTSDYFELDPSEISSIAKFNYEEIRRAPGGFEDVIRALSIVPGVGQASAGRNDLVVRGGAPSENLFLVDGLVIPNINHFGSQGATGGPLSYVNLDFVKSTSFSTGGFSAIYGDKLSSVLTIDLRDGRNDRFGGKGTISASQFGLNLEGPIGEKGSFIISARRSYLDFIFDAAGFNFVPEYWDGLAKFDYNLNAKNKLSFLFIGAFDRVKFNNETAEDIYDNSRILGTNQNQYVAGLSYRHLFDKGFYTISLARNFVDYNSFQKDTLLQPFFTNKSIEAENSLKADLVYKLYSTAELNIGASAKLIEFEADILLPFYETTFGDTLLVNSFNDKKTFYKYDFYAQYSDVFFHRLRLSAGIRGDYFNAIDEGFNFSPRFSLSYQLTHTTNINFSTGIYHQSPSYVWLAAIEKNNELKMVKVNQFVLGVEQMINDDLRFKAEAFYKDYNNYPASKLRTYLVLANTGAGFAGSDDNFASFGLEPLISGGSGTAKGVELSLQKKSSAVPLYGLVSLTLSRTNFTSLDGVSRSGTYDQKVIANLSGGYIFNEKWEASFKFRFATGAPYTPFNSDGTQSVSKYNSERFEAYHTLDLRVDRRWNFEGWSLITYIDVQNIYNRKNQTSIRWNKRENKVDDESSIGLLPSIGVSIEW